MESSINRLEQNLALLKKKSKASAYLLSRTFSDWQLTESGDWIRPGEIWPKEPAPPPLEDRGNLLVYLGLPLFFDIKPFIEWVERDPVRKIVWVEVDPTLAKVFLETERATELLSHPRITLLVLSGESEIKQAISNIIWGGVFYPNHPEVVQGIGSNYQKLKPNSAALFNLSVADELEQVSLSFECYRYEDSPEEQYVENFLALVPIFFANELKGKLKGIPIVVLAAGHSLKENIETIRRWQDYALLVTGGTTINLLNEAGIHPHIAALFDPSLNQFAKWLGQTSRAIPTFLCSRTHPWIRELIHAPLIAVPFHDAHADLGWHKLLFDGDRSFPNSVNAGESTTTFLMEIATVSGGEPCLLVGADYSYSKEGVRYPSKRVIHPLFENYPPAEPIKSKMIDVSLSNNPDKSFLMTGIFIHEVNWMRTYGERNLTFSYFHATQEGADLIAAKHLPPEEFEKRYLQKQLPIEEIVHKELFSLTHHIKTKERARDVLRRFKESFEKMLSLIDEIELAENEMERERLVFKLKQETGYRDQLGMAEYYLQRMQRASETLFGEIDAKEKREAHIHLFRSNLTYLIALYEKMLKETPLSPPPSVKEQIFTDERGEDAPFPYDEEGRLHGKVELFGENGLLMAESTFEQGRRVGVSRLFYGNGQLYRFRDFASRKEQHYYPSGALKSEYDPEENCWRDYYEEGTKKRIERVGRSDEIWDREGRLVLEMKENTKGRFFWRGELIIDG